MSGGHSGHADEGIIAHCGQSFQCHVAGSLDSPFIVLLKQDGADEACDGGLVGQIPRSSRPLFRDEAGRDSDMMPATIPR
jgi:hypothetical protein